MHNAILFAEYFQYDGWQYVLNQKTDRYQKICCPAFGLENRLILEYIY